MKEAQLTDYHDIISKIGEIALSTQGPNNPYGEFTQKQAEEEINSILEPLRLADIRNILRIVCQTQEGMARTYQYLLSKDRKI